MHTRCPTELFNLNRPTHLVANVLKERTQIGFSRALPHSISKISTPPHFGHPPRLACYSTVFPLSPWFPAKAKPRSHSYDIELVDDDAWRVSSGLAIADQGVERRALEESCLSDEGVDEPADSCSTPLEGDLDFDDIDNMRLRGRLFYKIDSDSKEYEEYSFDFHRRNNKKYNGPKESRNKKDDPKEKKKKKDNLDPKDQTKQKASSLKESRRDNPVPKLSARSEQQCRVVDNSRLGGVETNCVEKKKLRTPTYNQLTGPFHEPFCLDVYISKASVRACIVHRFTSKVVAMAHSISKDMK